MLVIKDEPIFSLTVALLVVKKTTKIDTHLKTVLHTFITYVIQCTELACVVINCYGLTKDSEGIQTPSVPPDFIAL